MSPSPQTTTGTPPPPPVSSQQQAMSPGGAASSVRRHHTITANTRQPRPISEETEGWNDDEVVDQDWVGGAGAVGERSSALHRHASLPSRSNRALNPNVPGKQHGTLTPRGVNSLSTIAAAHGLEGEGEEDEDWEQREMFARSESASAGQRSLDGHSPQPSPMSPNFGIPPNAPSPPPASASAIRRHQSLTYGAQRRQVVPAQSGLRRAGTVQATRIAHQGGTATPPTAEEQYEDEGLDMPEEYEQYDTYQNQPQQPAAPQTWQQQQSDWRSQGTGATAIDDVQRALANLDVGGTLGNGTSLTYASQVNRGMSPHQKSNPASPLQRQQRVLTTRSSNPNFRPDPQFDPSQLPPPPPIPAQYVNQQGPSPPMQHAPRMGYSPQPLAPMPLMNGPPPPAAALNAAALAASPIDVPTLIATRGYNPAQFDLSPHFARFFVIKSYTEDDVYKSLKHEIWSSTDPGNKRLDKAFKECAGRGPIYLFFSVNASGHFCGMAEMLTPVDYARSSTVWASDKWKGVFKVRWIFVRDIPNATLRHIRLNNTQERKPVTNSRDTQELLPEAGTEMLRIFFSHPARTSLLQDFAFYELQHLQKQAAEQKGQSQEQQQTQAPPPPMLPQQHPYAMSGPAALTALGYAPQGVSVGGMMPVSPYSQSMRGPSPVPVQMGFSPNLGARPGPPF